MHKFPDTRPFDVKRPVGPVDILVGIDRLSLHPTLVSNVGDLSLFQSLFGTGWLLGGSDPDLKPSSIGFDSKAHNLKHALLADECNLPNATVVNFLRTYDSSLSKF